MQPTQTFSDTEPSRRSDLPDRDVAARELAHLLGTLAHPQRIRILEELASGEQDVNTLQAAPGTTHSRVSQLLSLLRVNRLVIERRDGRHVYYRLSDARVTAWLAEGFRFLDIEVARRQGIAEAVEQSRQSWGTASD
jgi:DNA-binding transcriptional ArsR family regulator